MRHLLVVLALAPTLALTLAAAPLAAADHAVEANGMTFTPALVVVDPGDTVTWTNTGGFHNAAADDASFRCANGCDATGGVGDPASAPWTATVTFTDAGDVPYHCEIHGTAGGGGMSGVVRVALFRDGFESGDTGSWSSGMP